MLPIAALASRTATQRSLVGALGQDPCVADDSSRRTSEPERARRYDDGRALQSYPSTRRLGRLADDSRSVPRDDTDQRRAA
jgi:hypothetical protein